MFGLVLFTHFESAFTYRIHSSTNANAISHSKVLINAVTVQLDFVVPLAGGFGAVYALTRPAEDEAVQGERASSGRGDGE